MNRTVNDAIIKIKKIDNIELHLFQGTLILMHLAYLAIFFGILYLNQTYLRIFSAFIQLGVCLFLIIRFSPFKKSHEITKLDVSIIFYCATFLLMNVVLVELYTYVYLPLLTRTNVTPPSTVEIKV